MARPRPADEAGFTLVEMLVSVFIVAVVTAALTSLLTATSAMVSQQRSRQTASELADDGMELARADGRQLSNGRVLGNANVSQVPGVTLSTMIEYDALAASGPVALPLQTTTVVSGLTYQRYLFLGICYAAQAIGTNATVTCDANPPAGNYVQYWRVVVAVTWLNSRCTGGICSYVTSTLISCGTWLSVSAPCDPGEPAFRVAP